MAEYRVYCLDRHGRIWRRHDIEAADDASALAAAREFNSESACELWCGPRKVALLPPQGAPAPVRPAAKL